ncbi:unnamed protein product [Eretmochelys imbricata]
MRKAISVNFTEESPHPDRLGRDVAPPLPPFAGGSRSPLREGAAPAGEGLGNRTCKRELGEGCSAVPRSPAGTPRLAATHFRGGPLAAQGRGRFGRAPGLSLVAPGACCCHVNVLLAQE